MISGDTIGRHMELVARHLLGEPNKALSSKTEWRYGERGSMKVNLEDGLWHDFESDEKGGVFKLITRERGIAPKDIPAWLNSELGILVNGNNSQLVATYPYTDEDGKLLYEVLRYDPKDFFQRRPNGSTGQYIWGLGSAKRVLFRLPRLAARAPNEAVYICEGEKDVLTLEAWGLLATTNSGGAGGWKDSYRKWLKGADVVIVEHNDEAGTARSEKIAQSLHGVASSIAVLKLPGLPHKEDVTWWRRAGGTKDQFLSLCEQCQPFKPAPLPPAVQSRLEAQVNLGLDRRGDKAAPIANLNNASIILETDPSLKDLVWYDEFLQRIMTAKTGEKPRPWTDADDINLALYMQRATGVTQMAVKTVTHAVISCAMRHSRNCVKDWLETLKWDGVPRINHFFPEVFGVVDSEYARAVSRNFFIGLVARIYKPGCQLKNMVILEGLQDASKSKALNLLVGDAWFAEQHEAVTGKGFFEVLQGKWLVEIPEMDAFTRVEITRVKAVISCRSDRFRNSYGRHAEDHPRQCVFAGTCNKGEGGVFNDDTGAVRFWPMWCHGPINVENISATRNLLFAEAISTFKLGESWWEVPKPEAEAEQRARFVQDVWHDDILDYANSQVSQQVTVSQILSHLGKKLADQNRFDQMRVSSVLKLGGWKRKQGTDGKWRYVKDIPA